VSNTDVMLADQGFSIDQMWISPEAFEPDEGHEVLMDFNYYSDS
jgi:hypothetical protein